MATRTTVELLVNLQSGHDFIPAGRHIMEETPYAAILQAEIDSGSRNITVLGSVDVDEPLEEEGEGGPAATATPPRGGRKRTPAAVTE